jgi:speckle-type POZ protein
MLSTITTSKALHMRKCWTIRNWSGVAQIPGNILYDKEFEFANHRWRWRLYPGGVSDNVGDNVSLYLDCRDATNDHPAYERHVFRIVNQNDPETSDKPPTPYEQKSLPYKEHKDPDGWGWGKFIAHKKLNDPKEGLKKDDTIMMELDLTVYDSNGDHETTELDPYAKARQIEVPTPSLAADFGHLFSSEEFSDIAFLVGPARFRAHRAVLNVRSPVLAGLFRSAMSDSDSSEITVDEDISPDVFREILRFVYTGEVESTVLEDDPTNLLAAADRYGLDRLKTMCEHWLWDALDIDNASWYVKHTRRWHCVVVGVIIVVVSGGGGAGYNMRTHFSFLTHNSFLFFSFPFFFPAGFCLPLTATPHQCCANTAWNGFQSTPLKCSTRTVSGHCRRATPS